MDTFNLEISFSKLKAKVFSTSLTETSFLSFSLDKICWFDFSADGELLFSGPSASLPLFYAIDEPFLDAKTSFLFWIGLTGTSLFLSEYCRY